MRFKLFVLILSFMAPMLLSGCVTTKAYLADRARVDQELPAGAEDQYPNRSKTRKVMVVEVVEKEKAASDKVVTEETKTAETSAGGQSKVVTDSKETLVVHDSNSILSAQNPAALAQGQVAGAAEEYTVEKDDTLQKISKKFYGSYSKWTIIYDANREVIKDPNFLKPGKIIKIPVLPTASSGADKGKTEIK
jgi:nucleoid-associated protein YgaU